MTFTDIKKHITWFLSYENLFVIFILGGELQAFPLFQPISSVVDFKALMLGINVFVAFYLFIVKRKSFKLYHKGLILNILLFIALVFLSNILTPNDIKSDRKIFEFSIISIWVFFSGIFIINEKARLNRLLFMTVFWACILTFGAVLQLLGGGVGERQLIGGYTDETNHLLGRFSGGAIVIILPYLLSKVSAKVKLFLFVLIALLVIGLVSAGQRAPWLGLLFAIVYVPYLTIKWSNSGVGSFLKFSVLPIFMVTVGVFYFFMFTERGAYIAYRFERVSNNGRLLIYEKTWDNIRESPFFGIGFGNFSRGTKIEESRHPHNMFLEIQQELGLIGTILFLPIVFRFLILKRPNFYGDSLAYISLKALYWYFFINAMISGDITDNRYFYVILLALLNIYFLKSHSIEQNLSYNEHSQER